MITIEWLRDSCIISTAAGTTGLAIAPDMWPAWVVMLISIWAIYVDAILRNRK